MTHKLERRVATLETQNAHAAEGPTEIYLVAHGTDRPPVLLWRAANHVPD